MEHILQNNGHSIPITVNAPKSSKGIIVLVHGLGGTQDDDPLTTFSTSAIDHEYTVVRFSAYNLRHPKTEALEATVTSYSDDLAAVMSWLRIQPWYTQPWLVGYSFGAMAIGVHATAHVKDIAGIALIAPPTAGSLLSTYIWKRAPWVIPLWWLRTWRVLRGGDTRNPKERISWNVFKDLKKYDLRVYAHTFTMPTLIVAGEHDRRTPAEHIHAFYEKLPKPKHLHIVPNATHAISTQWNQTNEVVLDWIVRYTNA